MSRKLVLKATARKEFMALPLKDRKRVAERINALAEDPLPEGSLKLVGIPGRRIRVGDYRVIYEFDQTTVRVSKIGHRSQIYR